jgi:DNA-binding FadR family transcriptional regulator
MAQDALRSSILRYIVDEGLKAQGDGRLARLPAMGALCRRLGVSRGKLREELIAAEACGVVEMRPGDGTYVRPFDFYTPIRTLVLYSVALDRKNFALFYDLRTHLESALWEEATRKLSGEDVEELLRIVERARRRLQGELTEIPHREHKEFHLLTFARLDNEFVQGLLRAYWDAYEAVGLHLYFDYSYYEAMWSSHKAMAEAIARAEYGVGREMLTEHFTLLGDRLAGGNQTG